MPGIVRFEIHANDTESLSRFYSGLFGWKFTKLGGPMDYWKIDVGGDTPAGMNGGLIRRRGNAPVGGEPVNAFVCTVDVASVETSLALAVELGGEVALPIMPVPGGGLLCYAKDPSGNIFGMMQPASSATAG